MTIPFTSDQMQLTAEHVHRFEEIKRNLSLLGPRESAFVKVELLFFEALSIAREYGEDPSENSLLAALKEVQNDQYLKTKEATKKVNQREIHIKKFIVKLKRVLSVH